MQNAVRRGHAALGRRYAAGFLIVLLAGLTPVAVANRCAGESAAVQICACTVRSRLSAGWSESKVLSAYFAADQVATAEQIQQASDGLAGVGCPAGCAYFLFSAADIRKLGLRTDCSVAKAGGVWAFARDALQACRVAR